MLLDVEVVIATVGTHPIHEDLAVFFLPELGDFVAVFLEWDLIVSEGDQDEGPVIFTWIGLDHPHLGLEPVDARDFSSLSRLEVTITSSISEVDSSLTRICHDCDSGFTRASL